jgi:pimeloyl-ACP methyl ester carboxylesterase
MDSKSKIDKTVLLVHGAFHGAWCWEIVAEGLRELGIAVRTLDLPGHGMDTGALGCLVEDSARVREEIEATPGPVILCGHSYGGPVITEATLPGSRVEHLVYVAAGVPDVGEGLVDILHGLAQESSLMESMRPLGEGVIDVDPERIRELFFHDCDEEMATWATEKLDRQMLSSFMAPVTRAPWRELDSTYVVCSDDLVIPVSDQQRLAKRCRRSVTWTCGHSPMLSQPDRLVSLLSELVY